MRLSGTIFAPSLAEDMLEWWMSSMRAYHASHTHTQESKRETKTNEPFGQSLYESVERFNQDVSSSKTRQVSLNILNQSTTNYKEWALSLRRPQSGQRQRLVRRISENDSLPLLPTPTASTYGTNCGGAGGRESGKERPSLDTMVKTVPTPTARDHKDGNCGSSDAPTNYLLGRFVTRLPTPIASDARGSAGEGKEELPNVVMSLPTTTAGDARATGAAGYSTKSGRHSGTTLTDAVTGAAPVGRTGKLNPQFSEWMMGLEPGWLEISGEPTS